MVRMRRARGLGRLLSALATAVRHTWKARVVERERPNIASVSRSLEHTQNASIGQHIASNAHRRRRADRARSTSSSGDIASSAVAATDAGNGIGERHCAAFRGLLISGRQWSGGDGGLEQTSKKRMVEVLDSFPTVPI